MSGDVDAALDQERRDRVRARGHGLVAEPSGVGDEPDVEARRDLRGDLGPHAREQMQDELGR